MKKSAKTLKKKPSSMIARCDHCKSQMECEVVGEYSLPTEEEPEKVSLLQCLECDRPILVLRTMDEYAGPSKPLILFPQDVDFDEYPEEIRYIMYEAYRCLKNETYTAAVIMCRKVMEGVCQLKKARGRSLQDRIKQLVGMGEIDKQLFEWADLLRDTGNKAAHDVLARFSEQDAQDIMEFTRALCEYIFTLKDKFEAFKKRRTK